MNVEDRIIDLLVRAVMKDTARCRVLVMPGKDLYSEILALIANIVNERNHYVGSHGRMLSSEGAAYVFGKTHETSHVVRDPHVVYPFLDHDVIAYIQENKPMDEYVVYHRLFKF